MDIVSTRSAKKSRYTGSNLNAQLKSATRPPRRLARSGNVSLEVLEVRPRLSKLKKSKKTTAVPKPLNTPSQSHVHNGQDPTIDLLAKAGGTGWGADVEKKQEEAAAAAASASQTTAAGASGRTPGEGPWAAPAPAPEPQRQRRGLSDFNPFDRTSLRTRQPSVNNEADFPELGAEPAPKPAATVGPYAGPGGGRPAGGGGPPIVGPSPAVMAPGSMTTFRGGPALGLALAGDERRDPYDNSGRGRSRFGSRDYDHRAGDVGGPGGRMGAHGPGPSGGFDDRYRGSSRDRALSGEYGRPRGWREGPRSSAESYRSNGRVYNTDPNSFSRTEGATVVSGPPRDQPRYQARGPATNPGGSHLERAPPQDQREPAPAQQPEQHPQPKFDPNAARKSDGYESQRFERPATTTAKADKDDSAQETARPAIVVKSTDDFHRLQALKNMQREKERVRSEEEAAKRRELEAKAAAAASAKVRRGVPAPVLRPVALGSAGSSGPVAPKRSMLQRARKGSSSSAAASSTTPPAAAQAAADATAKSKPETTAIEPTSRTNAPSAEPGDPVANSARSVGSAAPNAGSTTTVLRRPAAAAPTPAPARPKQKKLFDPKSGSYIVVEDKPKPKPKPKLKARDTVGSATSKGQGPTLLHKGHRGSGSTPTIAKGPSSTTTGFKSSGSGGRGLGLRKSASSSATSSSQMAKQRPQLQQQAPTAKPEKGSSRGPQAPNSASGSVVKPKLSFASVASGRNETAQPNKNNNQKQNRSSNPKYQPPALKQKQQQEHHASVADVVKDNDDKQRAEAAAAEARASRQQAARDRAAEQAAKRQLRKEKEAAQAKAAAAAKAAEETRLREQEAAKAQAARDARAQAEADEAAEAARLAMEQQETLTPAEAGPETASEQHDDNEDVSLTKDSAEFKPASGPTRTTSSFFPMFGNGFGTGPRGPLVPASTASWGSTLSGDSQFATGQQQQQLAQQQMFPHGHRLPYSSQASWGAQGGLGGMMGYASGNSPYGDHAQADYSAFQPPSPMLGPAAAGIPPPAFTAAQQQQYAMHQQHNLGIRNAALIEQQQQQQEAARHRLQEDDGSSHIDSSNKVGRQGPSTSATLDPNGQEFVPRGVNQQASDHQHVRSNVPPSPMLAAAANGAMGHPRSIDMGHGTREVEVSPTIFSAFSGSGFSTPSWAAGGSGIGAAASTASASVSASARGADGASGTSLMHGRGEGPDLAGGHGPSGGHGGGVSSLAHLGFGPKYEDFLGAGGSSTWGAAATVAPTSSSGSGDLHDYSSSTSSSIANSNDSVRSMASQSTLASAVGPRDATGSSVGGQRPSQVTASQLASHQNNAPVQQHPKGSHAQKQPKTHGKQNRQRSKGSQKQRVQQRGGGGQAKKSNSNRPQQGQQPQGPQQPQAQQHGQQGQQQQQGQQSNGTSKGSRNNRTRNRGGGQRSSGNSGNQGNANGASNSSGSNGPRGGRGGRGARGVNARGGRGRGRGSSGRGRSGGSGGRGSKQSNHGRGGRSRGGRGTGANNNSSSSGGGNNGPQQRKKN